MLFKKCWPFAVNASLVFIAISPAYAFDDTGTIKSVFNTIHSGLDLIVPDEIEKHGFRVRLGAGFGSVPNYLGSNDYRLKTLPIIDIRYGKRLRLNFNRLSYAVIQHNNWEISPFVKYKSGRNETRNTVLSGLGNIGPTAEVGLSAQYKTSRMLFNIEYRYAVSSNQGSATSATFGHAIYKSSRFGLAAGLRGKWLSQKRMQTNFGITKTQAENSQSGFTAFSTSAGVSELSAHILARLDVSEEYRVLALVSYGRLVGDAAKSPLVAASNGNRNQMKIGVGFTIDF